MIKDGKGFISSRTELPANEVQFFRFDVGGSRSYEIDIKAKLCYLYYGGALTTVPCKSLKDGYPKIAPIITWQ